MTESGQQSLTHGTTWVTSPRKIARNYLRGWFGIDVFTVIPIDSFFLAASTDYDWESDGKLLRLLRTAHVGLLAWASAERTPRASRDPLLSPGWPLF